MTTATTAKPATKPEEKPIEPTEEESKEGEKSAEESAEGEEKAEGEEDPAKSDVEDPKKNDPPPGPRYKALIRVKIGEHTFSNLKGDFLGRTVVRLSSRQYSNARFVLNDPESYWHGTLEDDSECQIELGFADGEKRNKLVGKIWAIGRIPPDGTVVYVVDPGAAMAGTAPAVQQSAPALQEQAKTEEEQAEEDEAKAKGDEEAAKTSATATTSSEKEKPQDGGTQAAAAEAKEEEEPKDGFTKLTELRDRLGRALRDTRKTDPSSTLLSAATSATQGTDGSQLKASQNTNSTSTRTGFASVMTSAMKAMTKVAAEMGETIAVRGNTVHQTAPGQEKSSGVRLHYGYHRHAFIGKPEIFKRSPLQLTSSFTVQGYSVANHSTVGATVTMATPIGAHPTGNVVIPELGQIKLADPIFQGCLYTWNDATYNGSRMPVNQEVVKGIVSIAQTLQELSVKYHEGKPFKVNSWYRDPVSNKQVGGVADSRHLTGDAVDFYSVNMKEIFLALKPDYPGGVAAGSGFIHVDNRHLFGKGRSRWTYSGGPSW